MESIYKEEFVCPYCQRPEEPDKQHVIAKSNGGMFAKPIGKICHHKELNPTVSHIFRNLKRGLPIPETIQVGSKDLSVTAGSAQLVSPANPMYFLPIVENLTEVVQVQALPKDFNQGEYPVGISYSGGTFTATAGSPNGWVYVVGVFERVDTSVFGEFKRPKTEVVQRTSS